MHLVEVPCLHFLPLPRLLPLLLLQLPHSGLEACDEAVHFGLGRSARLKELLVLELSINEGSHKVLFGLVVVVLLLGQGRGEFADGCIFFSDEGN